MCLAIPGKVINIDGETALIDYDGIKKEANVSLIDCSIGDFVLVHVGFAIQIVDEESARQTYSLLDEADRRLEEERADEERKTGEVDHE